MKLFFSTHVCSRFCSKLKLRAVDAESLVFGGLPQTASSSSTSSDSSDIEEKQEVLFQEVSSELAKAAQASIDGLGQVRPQVAGQRKTSRPVKKQKKEKKLEQALEKASYVATLYEFLKKHGRTELSQLGSQVPRAAFVGAPKLTAVLKAHSQKFVITGNAADIIR